MRKSFSRPFCRLLQAGCIAGLDFIPQRGALAVGNRRIKRRGALLLSSTASTEISDKSRSIQFRADAFHIVVAVRGAGHETRRIMRKQRCQRFRHDISKLVLRNSVPYIEKEFDRPA